jgi:hypothetical protein
MQNPSNPKSVIGPRKDVLERGQAGGEGKTGVDFGLCIMFLECGYKIQNCSHW